MEVNEVDGYGIEVVVEDLAKQMIKIYRNSLIRSTQQLGNKSGWFNSVSEADNMEFH